MRHGREQTFEFFKKKKTTLNEFQLYSKNFSRSMPKQNVRLTRQIRNRKLHQLGVSIRNKQCRKIEDLIYTDKVYARHLIENIFRLNRARRRNKQKRFFIWKMVISRSQPIAANHKKMFLTLRYVEEFEFVKKNSTGKNTNPMREDGAESVYRYDVSLPHKRLSLQSSIFV